VPAFDEEYARLNKEQKLAVDTVEGPVMVVAGPGTGKTQVLAVRVANILKKTQARPSNILCLTFSTSGSTAMRERLRSLIGPDAYRVTVSTVHSFCDAIIMRHPQVFEDFAARKQISDIEKYEALQRIIDTVSDRFALINPKNPYDRIPDILGRISDCKREGKTFDELQKVAREYETEMAGKSKEGTKAHQKNVLQARKFNDFVELFRLYQEYLTEKGAYDYDDMILVVLKALTEEEWLLQSLQERYQYLLVDEAQDLNGSQWKIIERLTSYDHPNFFLVGDDDQAIYRFQGANIEHMLAFRERFPLADIIVLRTNYRSTQAILDASARLIAHNEERLVGRIPGLHKDLVSSTGEEGQVPILLRTASDSAEPWVIADIIDERIKAGIPPQEIAVLVQTNAELRPIYDVLRARGIPVVLHGKADLLTHPVVMQLLTILRSAKGHDDGELLRALACECFGCKSSDVSRLSFLSRTDKTKVEAILLDLEEGALPFIDRESLIRSRDVLFDLRERQGHRTVLDTVEQALRRSGISASAEKLDPIDLAVVEEFFHYVKQRCLDKPGLTLAHFLRDLEFYADDGFSQVRLTYQIPHLVSEGVELLTAHQSKGLEFHTVMIAQFRDGHWDERRRPVGLALPEELLFGWQNEQKRVEQHQDERRVGYVAMTRAKRELLLLCPKEFAVGERARTVSPSAFFSEAGPLPESDKAIKDPARSSLLLFGPDKEPDEELDAYLRERIETFALSPTSLARFLDDPQEFRRVDLLGQPQMFTEQSMRAMGYGSAVHWALKDWAADVMKKEPLSEKKLLDAFKWHLYERNILTEQQRRDLLAQGNEALPLYFASRLQSTPYIYAVEKDISVRMEDIPLKGKIDRIDLLSETSSSAIVIDYKTGRPKTPGEIRGGIEEGRVSRGTEGSYFRQLVFYALLMERGEPLLVPQAFALEFIGERGEDPLLRSFVVTDPEKDDLRQLIRAVWKKIMALDFTPLS